MEKMAMEAELKIPKLHQNKPQNLWIRTKQRLSNAENSCFIKFYLFIYFFENVTFFLEENENSHCNPEVLVYYDASLSWATIAILRTEVLQRLSQSPDFSLPVNFNE